MIFLKKLRDLLHENREAIVHAEASKEKADRNHAQALEQQAVVNDQAKRLGEMDRRNHYSEGLTKSFQGRTA